MTDTDHTASSVASPQDEAARSEAAAADRALTRRMEAQLELAEQTARVAQELETAPPIEARSHTALAVSVVIPCYNERETIVEIVRRVQMVGVHHEIIIVDDFSTDGTRDLLLLLDNEPDIRVLFHGYNRGKGAALRTGFSAADGEVVMIQDADLEYNPNDLPRLLAPIERGEADVVYGSRFLENAHQDPSRMHRFGNWLLTAASNAATGQKLTDMETCYKVFRREVIERINIEQKRFGFEPEITAKVSKLGYKILELPIGYDSRGYEEGKKIGWRDAVNAFYCIAKYGGRN